jgi:hypothetical protein
MSAGAKPARIHEVHKISDLEFDENSKLKKNPRGNDPASIVPNIE